MKKQLILTLSLLIIATFAFGQEEYSYHVWETTYIIPKKGHGQDLGKALLEHKKMFHPEGTHNATIHAISVGKMQGAYSWMIGPMKFADVDNKPKGENYESWMENGDKFVKKYGNTEYWVSADKLSYWPENPEPSAMIHCIYWDVKQGKQQELDKLLAKAVKVFKENKYKNSWGIYKAAFNTGSGRDVCAVMTFDNWAYFDSDLGFVKDYETMYGEGTFAEFMDSFYSLIESGTDEIRKVVMDY